MDATATDSRRALRDETIVALNEAGRAAEEVSAAIAWLLRNKPAHPQYGLVLGRLCVGQRNRLLAAMDSPLVVPHLSDDGACGFALTVASRIAAAGRAATDLKSILDPADLHGPGGMIGALQNEPGFPSADAMELLADTVKLETQDAIRRVDDGGDAPLGASGRWELEAGGFKFDGTFYDLAGKPLALLRVFVQSPRRQTFGYDDLRAAWADDDNGDSLVEQSTIRATISDLRAILHKVAAAANIHVVDPLPGNRGSWRFCLPR